MLRLGETYVDGHDKATATQLLTACHNLGIPPLKVRTTDNGFIVPNEVADEVERMTVPQWSREEAVF